jgi:arylsulfatase A-like enzyme
MPCRSTAAGAVAIFAAVVGVGLPLEFLPILPGVLHYASPLQALAILAELGLVFTLGASGLALMTWLTSAIANFIRPGTGTRLAAVFARVLALLFLLHSVRAWLFAIGVMTPASPLARGVWWMLVALAGCLLVLRSVWRNSAAAPMPAVVRRGVMIMFPLLAAGAVLRVLHPLNAARPEGLEHVAPAPTLAAHPDVVVVTIDTLSADHMSLYGYERPTTPRLQQLAATSTVFERFYANGNFTTAGVSSLMLGTRPWTHGAVLAPSTPTHANAAASLPGWFHQAGYRVLTVSTNPWASPAKLDLMQRVDAHVSSRPWRRACPWDADAWADSVLSPQTASILGVAGYWAPLRARLLEWAVDTGRCPPSGHFDPDQALRAARTLWDAAHNDGRPVLLWVHLTPPHDPYAPPPPFIGLFDAGPQARRVVDSSPRYHRMTAAEGQAQRARLLGRYDEAVRYVDNRLGAFFDGLQADGRLDSSLLVVTADHGESFGHNYGAHGGPELYEDIVRIPLLVRLPGQRDALRVAVPAEQADLLPTLSDLAGLPRLPDDFGIEGRSLAVAWRKEGLPARPVFAMTFERQSEAHALTPGTVAVVDGQWKLHRTLGPPASDGAGVTASRLFDVIADPAERHDLASARPDVVARLQALVDTEVQRRRVLAREPRR